MAHTPLWFATFWKRKQAGSAEIVKLVVHEGDWTFGLLIRKSIYFCLPYVSLLC